MKKKTIAKVGILATAAGGGLALYVRNKKYYKKYSILKELRSINPFIFPETTINSTFMKLMNRQYKDVIVENKNVITTSLMIPTYDGKEILVNVMQPIDCKEDEKLPCMVYYHGGAFILGATPGFYPIIEEYVNQVRCKVVFPHYRTIYEGSTDACFEDAFSAAVWTYENAEKLKIDKERIALGGDSAGGALTAAVTHMLRERKGPKVIFQMLIYPATDSTLSTPSMKKYTDTPGWNAKANAKMWKEMKTRLSPGLMKYVAPILDFDFTGLCNAYIEVEEFDCLHDEGILYAEKLISNGYEVELNDMKGTYHGFEQIRSRLIARQIFEVRSRALRKAFGIDE